MKASDPQKITHKATNIFTDREEPRAAFWRLYHAMEPDEIEVINYYGVGGIGKSSLLKQLQLELSEHGNEKYVEYNFENKKTKDMVLFDLSRQMMKKCKGLQFPVFDYAFEKYKTLVGEEHVKYQLLESENILDHRMVGNTFSVVGDYVPYVGTVSTVITEGVKAIANLTKKHEQLKGKNSELYHEITRINSSQVLFNSLQHYFAIDAFGFFNGRNDTPLVVMLDGYEVFVNRLERGRKASGDDLWLREEGSLLMSIPNTIWVIAGREKLEWDKEILPQDHTHLIGDLSEADAITFFQRSGLVGQELLKGLYSLTNGTPVYMDLCVKQYKNLKTQNVNYEPCLDDFGKNTEEIAVRFLRDMTIMEQGIMHLLACMPNTWNDFYVTELARRLQYDFSQNEYRLIKEMTLVEEVDAEREFYRLHETFRRIVYSQIHSEEKQRILNALKDILIDRMIAVDVTMEEFQYVYVACVDMCKKEFEKLTLSTEDVRKITWTGMRCSLQDEENLQYLAALEKLLWDAINKESLSKYVRCTEMYVRSLFYYERNSEALEVTTRVMNLLQSKSDIDEETRIKGYCLHGWQLFNMDRNQESLEILEQAYGFSQSEKELSYVCRKDLLNKLLQVTYSFCEDLERYDILAQEYIEMCEKEMVRLQSEPDSRKNRERVNKIRCDEAEMLAKLERFDDALELYQTVLDTYKEEGYSQLELCSYRCKIAEINYYANRFEDALETYLHVLQIYQKEEADMLDLSDVCGEIRECYLKLGEYESALTYALESVSYAEKESENSDFVATEKLYLAEVYQVLGESEKAERCYLESIAIQSELLGAEHTETCEAKGMLAYFYMNIEQYEKAYQIYQKIYARYCEVFGEIHKKSLNALMRIGDCMYFMEDFECAKNIHETVYKELEKKENCDVKEVALAAESLARTSLAMGDMQSAQTYSEKAVALLENEEIPNIWCLYDAYMRCVYVYKQFGDFEGVINMTKKCLKLIGTYKNAFKNQYWDVYMQYADALSEVGECEQALSIHREVVAHFEESGELESEIDARLSISIDLEAMGRVEEALEVDKLNYERAVICFGVDSEGALTYYEFVAEDLEALGREEEAENIRNYVESKRDGHEM